MRAQHLAQRRMQQVRAGVVARCRRTLRAIDHRIQRVAHGNGPPHRHAMRKDALHRLGAAMHIGQRRRVVRRIQPACVAHLPAAVRIEAGSVEHDLTLVAGLQHLHANAILHQRQDIRIIGTQTGVTNEVGLFKRGISRARSLLRTAFPGGSRSLLFFFFG